MPKVHSSQVVGMCAVDDGTLISAGWDDTVAVVAQGTPEGAPSDNVRPQATKLASQPRAVACAKDGSLTVVACQRELITMRRGGGGATLKLTSESTAVALHPSGKIIAYGAMVSYYNIIIY